MMLEELRKRVKEKKEEIMNNPEETNQRKEFILAVDELFDDIDALSECHESTLQYILYFIDSPLLPERRRVYKELMEEVNQKYTLVDPDMFAEALNHEKQRTEDDT